MFNYLKKKAVGFYANWTGGRRELKTFHLLGEKVVALPGTIRQKPDQDDAWFVWLAAHRKRLYVLPKSILLCPLAG